MKKLLNILLFVFAAQVLQAQSSIDSTTLKIVPARGDLFYEIPNPGVAADNIIYFTFGGKWYKKLNTSEKTTDGLGIYTNGNNYRARLQGLIDSSYITKISIASLMPGYITLNGDSIDFRGKTLLFKGGVQLKGTTKIKNVLIEADKRDFILDTSIVLGENVKFSSGEISVKNFGAGKGRTAAQNATIFKKISDYAFLYRGQTILFPEDDYLIRRKGTKMIETHSYTTYKGEGMYKSRFILDSSDYYNFRRIFDIGEGDSSITIKDLGFNMILKGTNYDSASVDFKEDDGDPATDYQSMPIFAYSADSTKPIFDLTIENIYAQDIPGDIIGISKNTHYVHIRKARFKNYIRQGISLGGGNVYDVWIDDVVDLGSTTVTKVGGHSIHCEPYAGQYNINYWNSRIRDFSYSGVLSGSIKGVITYGTQILYCNNIAGTEISGNEFASLLQIAPVSAGNVTVSGNKSLNGIYITSVSGGSSSPKNIVIRDNPNIKTSGREALWNNGIDSVIVDNNTFENDGEVCVRMGNAKGSIVTNNRIYKRGTGNHQALYLYSSSTGNYGAGMDYVDGNIIISNYRGIQIGNKSAIIGPSNVVTAPTPYELSTAKIFPYRGADGKQFLAFTGSALPTYKDWAVGDIITTNTTIQAEPTEYRCDTAGALHQGNWSAALTYYINAYVRDSTNGRIYRSKASNGQNELPSADTDNTYWEQVATRTATFKATKFNGLISRGAGSPEGVVIAPGGAVYYRSDGDSCTSGYIKTTPSGNTGWRAFGCGGSGGGLSIQQAADLVRDSLLQYKGNDTIFAKLERPASNPDLIEFTLDTVKLSILSPADSTFKGTVAQLRANNTTRFRTATTTDFGTGQWYKDASDASSADNTGTVIVDAAGTRWKRQRDGGDVRVEWFTTSTNLTTSMPAMIAATGEKARVILQPVIYSITKDSTLRLNKKFLTLDLNGATIKPDSSYTVLSLQADSITIRNGTIDLNFKSHNGIRGTGYKGLWLENYTIKNQHKKSDGQTGGVFLITYGNVYISHYTARQINNSDTVVASHSPAFKVDGGFNINAEYLDFDTVGVGGNLVGVDGGKISRYNMRNIDDNAFYYQSGTKNIQNTMGSVWGVEEGIVLNTGLTLESNNTFDDIFIYGATNKAVTFRAANSFKFNNLRTDSCATSVGQSGSFAGVKNGDFTNFTFNRTVSDRTIALSADSLISFKNGKIKGFLTLNTSAIRIATSDSITIANVNIEGDGVNLQYGIRHSSSNNTFTNNPITKYTGGKIRNDGGTNIKSIDAEEVSSSEKYKIQAAKGFVYTKLTYAQMQAISSPESMSKVCTTDSLKCYTYISGVWKEDRSPAPLITTRNIGSLSSDQRKIGDTLTDIIDSRTGQYLTFIKATALNGVTITDPDVDTVNIVKIVSDYFIRVVPGDIDVNTYKVVADGTTDNTAALQKAANFANKFKKKLYFPAGAGVYVVKGKVTLDPSVYISFAPGAVLGIDSLIGGIPDIQPWQYVFTDTSIINPSGLARGNISAKNFGAKGDNTNDDQKGIQAAVDFVARNNSLFTVVDLPTGVYKINNPIACMKWNASLSRYEQITVTLQGEGVATAKGSSRGTKIVVNYKDRPGIWFQIAKGGGVKGLSIEGLWTNPSLSDSAFYNSALSTYGDPTCRDSRYSPYAAIVVDAVKYTGAPADGGYTGFNYTAPGNSTTSGSTGLEFKDLYISSFTVCMAFSPNGQTQNDDAITVTDVNVANYKVGFASCQDQEKGNIFKSIIAWGKGHTLFTNSGYGAVTSGHIVIDGVNMAGKNAQFISWSAGGRYPSMLSNIYTESLGRIGSLTTTSSRIEVNDCLFALAYPSEMQGFYPDYHINTSAGVNFKGCTFMLYSLMTPIVIKHNSGTGGTFTNCYFETTPAHWVDEAVGSPNYINCTISGSAKLGGYSAFADISTSIKTWSAYGNWTLTDRNSFTSNLNAYSRVESNSAFIARQINAKSSAVFSVADDRTATISVDAGNEKYFVAKRATYVLSGSNRLFAGIVQSIDTTAHTVTLQYIPNQITSTTYSAFYAMCNNNMYGFLGNATAGSNIITGVRNTTGVAAGDLIVDNTFQFGGAMVTLVRNDSVWVNKNSAYTKSVVFNPPGVKRVFVNPSATADASAFSASTIMATGDIIESRAGSELKTYKVTKGGYWNATSVGGGETRQAEWAEDRVKTIDGQSITGTGDLDITVTKNATRDSIVVTIGANRYAVKDSIGSSAGSLPTKPANLLLWSLGSGNWDTSGAIQKNGTNGNIGIWSAPTEGLTIDSAHSFNSGITMHGRADQTTNALKMRLYPSSSNSAVYNISGQGSVSGGFHDWRINNTSYLTLDALQAVLTGSLLFSADNTKTIGRKSSNALRPSSIYVATSMQVGAAANTNIGAIAHLGPSTTSLPHWLLESGVAPSSPLQGMGWRDNLNILNILSSLKANRLLLLKDSTTKRTTTGARQMLVLDTSTNNVERMDIPTTASVDTTIISTKANVDHQIRAATEADVFAPSRGNPTNVASSTVESFMYQRINNIVHYKGRLKVTASGAGATSIDLALPIAATLSAITDLSGTGSLNGVTFDIQAAPTLLNVARISFTATGAVEHLILIDCMYELP